MNFSLASLCRRQHKHCSIIACGMELNMNTNAVAAESKVAETYTEKKTSRVSGRTIGKPELSEKAQKYYEQLKKKFGNMEFILVSPDMKEQAEANASAYASSNKTVVLIDSDKIEKMAEDEEYRKKYEGIISNAQTQLAQLQSSLSQSGANVKSYGIKINDGGTASFFAVIDKSLAAQKERIQEKAEKKAAERKKNQKEQAEERVEKRREARREADDNSITITGSSIEDLNKKINEYLFMERTNQVETEEEKVRGRNVDFAV